jgi:hypothetical protein
MKNYHLLLNMKSHDQIAKAKNASASCSPSQHPALAVLAVELERSRT